MLPLTPLYLGRSGELVITLTVVREAAHKWSGYSNSTRSLRESSAREFVIAFSGVLLGMPTPGVGNPNACDVKFAVSD
jgi:hypothetical protein